MSTLPERYDSALVISDMHLGLPDCEIFREDFERFIDYVASTDTLRIDSGNGSFQIKVPQAILLLGDFLDLWDGSISRISTFSAQFARVLTEKANVFLLRGNHDYIIPDIEPQAMPGVRKFQICEYKVLDVGGKSCFFIHGHQFMSAFGSASLRIESYINPYHSMMESFFSRLSWGRGRQILLALTGLFAVLLIVLFGGPSITGKLHDQAVLVLWMMLGLLLPLAIVNIWRLAQKTLWKLLVMIFGELMDSLRGAAAGDTIDYLTSPSRPISRWFAKHSEGSADARKSSLVCFGHTHIPEGPQPPKDQQLSGITFLNTGSWARPPSVRLRGYADKIRAYTRLYDRLDEYVVLLFPFVVALFAWLGFALSVLTFFGAALFLAEVAVVLGKSSYEVALKSNL
jgi:UDP-2,3-diacylglucosamine pyrophosphatase LpxH